MTDPRPATRSFPGSGSYERRVGVSQEDDTALLSTGSTRIRVWPLVPRPTVPPEIVPLASATRGLKNFGKSQHSHKYTGGEGSLSRIRPTIKFQQRCSDAFPS